MVGIALLGAGRMARVHTEAIHAAGAEVVTIYDAIPAAAEKLAAEVGAIVCGSAAEAMSHRNIDAIDGLRAAYLAEAATTSLATRLPIQLTSIDQEF